MFNLLVLLLLYAAISNKSFPVRFVNNCRPEETGRVKGSRVDHFHQAAFYLHDQTIKHFASFRLFALEVFVAEKKIMEN